MDYTNIYGWARQALGVSPTDTDTVPNADLALLAASEVSELVDLYPCIAVAGEVALTGSDLTNFEEAAGLRTGARYLLSPSGKQLVAKQVQVKVGPVTETYSESNIPDVVAGIEIRSRQAIQRVACVKGARKFTSIADITGRRRTASARCQIGVIVAGNVNPNALP